MLWCSELCAQVLGLGSVILVIVSGPRLDLLPASMVVTGFAINLIAFPALILEDYFPGRSATTASFVVSCQCLSSIVAPVLWLLWGFFPWWTFGGIWAGYLFFVWIPFSVFYISTLPAKREISIGQPSDQEPREPGELVQREVAEVNSKDFKQACCSAPFVLLNLVNVVLMLQVAFYQVIVRRESGTHISDFLGWTMPLQAVWGLILGRIVDRVKTPAMTVLLLNAVRLRTDNLSCCSSFLQNSSWLFTCYYCWVDPRFSMEL